MSLSATLFALMNYCARVASADVPWTMVAASRAFVGALIAMAVARARGVSFVAKRSRAMWLRSLFGTASMMCTFYALGSADIALGDAVTLVSLGPMFIALLGPIVLGERSGRRVALALPVALTGVIFVVRPSFVFGYSAAHASMVLPATIALLGAFFSSFAMMMLRQVSDGENAEAIATHFSLTAAGVLFLVSLPRFMVPAGRDLAIMIGAGLCAGFAQLAMTRAYALEMAARVSPFSYLSIVVTALLGAVSLHQWPDGLAVLGMGLVIAGGVIVTIAGIRDTRALAPKPS